MIVHFICRGNAFRSVMAEAYLNSKRLPGVTAISSGTVGGANKEANSAAFKRNQAILKDHGLETFTKDHHGDQLTPERIKNSDVVVFLNQIVRDEYDQSWPKLPARTYVWNITDASELAHPPETDAERVAYARHVLHEISQEVDTLIAKDLKVL